MNVRLQKLIATFESALSPGKVIYGGRLENRDPGYCRAAYDGGILLLPESTADVAAICKTANANLIALVPHGGLTGLVDATGTEHGEVAVSFERMNRIRRVDPAQGIAIAEAGVTLDALIAAAGSHNLRPGVDLPSRGTCTLGGMAGTNAGGIQAIRYGMMRDNILGMTVVLASGEVLDLSNTLVKNNAGYDLKHQFIGSEGTLGLITELVVKLHPRPLETKTALVGCPSDDCFAELLQLARSRFGNRLLSFEAMWPDYVDVVGAQPGMGPRPLSQDHAAYGLIEIGTWDSTEANAGEFEAFLEATFEVELVSDAVVAQSEGQRAALWRIREDSDAIEARHQVTLTYDVGLELKDIPAYVTQLDKAIQSRLWSVSAYYFGHVGDGNLHVMLGGDKQAMANRDRFDEVVYGVLSDFQNTTISAEHGIGLEKRDFLNLSRSSETLSAMKHLKNSFDPAGILNPGKVFLLHLDGKS